MRKLIDRLMAKLGYVRIDPTRPTLEQACFEFGKREASARHESYNVGLAQGELWGRQAMAGELISEFGLNERDAKIDPAAAERVTARMVH